MQQNDSRRDLANVASVTSRRPLKFDVVLVRQSDPHSNRRFIDIYPDGIHIGGFPLRYLIHLAYGISTGHIYGGPKWIDSTTFEIQAKVAGKDVGAFEKMSREAREAMLSSVLMDRFGLVLHCGNKVLPFYELVRSPKGERLMKHPDPISQTSPADVNSRARGSSSIRPNDLTGTDMSMAQLTKWLQSTLHQTVIDKTDLHDNYDFHLKWSPSDISAISAQTSEKGMEGQGSSDFEQPLFSALQDELGLELHHKKGPIMVLVVDQAHLPVAE